jgi:hypothetical protein
MQTDYEHRAVLWGHHTEAAEVLIRKWFPTGSARPTFEQVSRNDPPVPRSPRGAGLAYGAGDVGAGRSDIPAGKAYDWCPTSLSR